MKVNQLMKTIEKYNKPFHTNETTYILAVSMGVDSAVLLETFRRLPYMIHVVHFNHRRRVESENEALHIKMYCEHHNIPLDIIDVPSQPGNFQNQARIFRYQQLKEVAARYQKSVITTAHHFDDQVETYIQRLFGGSSIASRSGMDVFQKKGEVQYFRPFLHIEKKVLYESAIEAQIVYFEDQSNQENSYQRNQIRNQILPQIADCFPAYKQAVAKDFEETRLLYAYLEDVYIQFKQQSIQKNGSMLEIDYMAFLSQHDYLQNIIIERCVKELGFHLKRDRYREIRQMIARQHQSYMIKKDLYLHVLNEKIIIGLSISEKYQTAEYDFFLCEGFFKLPKQYKMWYNDRNSGSDDFFELNQEDLPFLKVRNSKSGDKVQIGDVHKRVSRLFIDKKLLHFKRHSYPVVEDIRTGQIVWVPMFYKIHIREKTERKIQIFFSDGGFHA